VPLALSAGLAGLLLFFAFFAIQSGRQNGTAVDFATVEEAAIGGRLGLLEQYQVVERLDLLEEFDVDPRSRPDRRRADRLVMRRRSGGLACCSSAVISASVAPADAQQPASPSRTRRCCSTSIS